MQFSSFGGVMDGTGAIWYELDEGLGNCAEVV